MEQLNFDDAMTKLEGILDDLESNGESMDSEEAAKKLEEAEALKDYCKTLLKKEKEDLIRTAKENNISLDEIGISEDDDDEFEEKN